MLSEEDIVTNGYPAGPKPAILCLHGGGTNAVIFKIQMVRITRALHSHFEFVFLDGPIEAEPGPGVLPVFEGLGPYLRWTIYGANEKPAVTDTLLRNFMEERRKKDGRGFVGVIGFSQGAKTAAGLLLEQQVRQRKEGTEAREGLEFGVLMMNGGLDPLTTHLTDEEKAQPISISALHVVGSDDPWREDGYAMFKKHFDANSASLMEFDVGHRLPTLEEDTKKMTDQILSMYWNSEAGRQTEHSTVVA